MKAALVLGSRTNPGLWRFRRTGRRRAARAASPSAPPPSARSSRAGPRARITVRPGDFPFVAGIDGVGRLDDGRRVYFVLPRAPYGSMAEVSVVPSAQCIAVPDELDDVTAAAIANPGMSSWAAYAERARLRAGETVLVNGADRHVGPPRHPDRETPGREEGDCHRAQRRCPAIRGGARRRCDHTAGRGRVGAGGCLQASSSRRRRRRDRLPVGAERPVPADRGRQGRHRMPCRSASFRSARRARRTSACRARCCARRRSN